MDGMDAFQVNTQPSDAILSIKSPLRYKYKPTLRYAVELYRAPRPAIGELRVSARTQSQGLLESLTGFYQLWIQLETHYIGSRFPGGKIPCQVQEGRYCRQFFLPRGEIGSEEPVSYTHLDVYKRQALTRACIVEKDFEDIKAKTVEYLKETLSEASTFKVEAKRSDKTFPMNTRCV